MQIFSAVLALGLGILWADGTFNHAQAFTDKKQGEQYVCSFTGVGTKSFSRLDGKTSFTSDKGAVFEVLENQDFLQLRSAEIDPDNVNNAFTVYLIDKKTKRIRQISGAMRAAPMMADGRCQYLKK